MMFDALLHPALHAVSVTPDDNNDLVETSRGLYVGAAGDVVLTLAAGATVTFTSLAAGVIHPLRVRRVHSTGTTASGIVVVY